MGGYPPPGVTTRPTGPVAPITTGQRSPGVGGIWVAPIVKVVPPQLRPKTSARIFPAGWLPKKKRGWFG